jgi:hypothetical protein
MKPAILATALALFGLSFATMGCSRAAVICEITCECEHCSDQAKIEACNELATAEDVANAYDCGDKWDDYTVCVEDRGTCDEKESRFSFMNDMGENRCQNERDALNDCIDNASGHDGNVN